MTTTYNPSGAPTAETRGTSSAIRNEFQSVAAVVNGKGDIGGQVWTGIHTFPATTYGVTAAFGSTGTAFATLDYVNAVAISAALPGQTGNAGKLPITNGTTVAWSGLLNTGVIRLADGTDPTKQVAFDASGLTTGTTRTITLPDASGTLALKIDTAMQLLGIATVSTAVANIDFLNIFSTDYDKYIIEVQGVKPSASDQLAIRVASAGAVVTTNYTAMNGYGVSSPPSSTTQWTLIQAATTVEGSFTVEILNTNSVGGVKVATVRGALQTGTSASSSLNGAYAGSAALSGFRLYWSAGANFTTGTVRVYGIKNS